MGVLLALAWGLPLCIAPQVGGGALTFRAARSLLLILLAPAAPWWRGTWTRLEWALAIVIVAQTARMGYTRNLGLFRQGAIWLAGLLVLRAARGLPEDQRAFLRRWWWLPMPLVFAYGCAQPWLPAAALGGLPAGTSTFGNPLFTSEALLLLLGTAPAPVAALAMIGPFLFRSRGVMLALAASAAWMGRRHLQEWYRAVLALLPSALLAAVLGYLAMGGTPATLDIRWEIWRRTLAVITEHPIAGVGMGGYVFAVAQGGIPAESVLPIWHAHNDYLERAAEWGIPAGILFAVWITRAVRGSWGLTAVALAALVQFPFSHPATWPLWCLVAGSRGPVTRTEGRGLRAEVRNGAHLR